MNTMKVVVDLPGRLERVQRAIELGGYDSPSQFVNVAIENQIELELDGVSHRELKTINEEISKDRNKSDETATSSIEAQQSSTEVKEDILALRECTSVATVAPPDTDRLDSGPLWGQYNRIFPVKIMLRVLVNDIHQRANNKDGRNDSQ